MFSPTINRIRISLLRRMGFNLDLGHTWERLSAQYSNTTVQVKLYEFVIKLLPIWMATKNEKLIERAKNDSQMRDSTSLLGDHYKLLKSIAVSIDAAKVIDIGTYTGMSSLAFMDAGCEVMSFDIVSPFDFNDCLIQDSDLENGNLNLITENLMDDNIFRKYSKHFIDADIIFFDGPKFGGFEQKLLPKILNLEFRKNTLVIMDDIQMKKMKILWYEIEFPRLDLTLLGHLSGTGVIFPYLGRIDVSVHNN